MAYRDPYAQSYGHQQQGSYGNEFDPYANAQRQYNQGPGYYQQSQGRNAFADQYPPQSRASPAPVAAPAPQRQATMRSFLTSETESTRPNFKEPPPLPTMLPKKETDANSGFEAGEFSEAKDISSFSKYRSAHQADLWTKGGRSGCVGRFCCCTIMTTVVLFLSILGALALWIRPPAISIDNVGPPADGQTIQLQQDGIIINLAVNIFVSNPNYFSVSFKKIKAEIIYPINDTPVGGGESDNLDFAAHSSRNFTFPFQINYQTSLDPRGQILADLAQKCGVSGPKSQLTVKYKITLGIRILLVTISPSVSNQFSFLCPLDPNDLKGLMGGASGTGGLAGLRELPALD